jgi:RNA polymerase sigma factor (sigma-70 family)
MSQGSVAPLVVEAGAGSQEAWNDLVGRFASLVWAIARSHGLDQADAGDVSQTTWLRLVENLNRIRDPEKVGAWLASTARNECLRLLRRAGRQVPLSEDKELEDGSDGPAIETHLLETERDAALWRAFRRLGERCRMLLRLLMSDPPASYEEISVATGWPLGSIGPTRARCLQQLRRHAAAVGIAPGDISL